MTEVVRGGTNRSAGLNGRENTISGTCCRNKEAEKVKSWSTTLHVRPRDAEEVFAGSDCSRSSSPQADLACKVDESQRTSGLAPSNIFDDFVAVDPCSSAKISVTTGELLSRPNPNLRNNGTDERPMATLKKSCREKGDQSCQSFGPGSRTGSISKTAPISTSGGSISAAPSSSSNLTDSKGAGVKNRKTGSNFRKRRANGVCLDLTKDAISMCQTDIAKDLNRWSPANRTPRGASTSKQRTPRPPLQSLSKSSMLQFGLKPGYCIYFAFIILLVLSILLGQYAYLMRGQVQLLEMELQSHENALRNLGTDQRGCPGGKLDILIKTLETRDDDLIDSGSKASTRSIRSFALFIAIIILMTPFFCVKYIDEIHKLSRSTSFKRPVDNRGCDEEVPLSKRVAYQVDVLFSNHAFVKPLALLVATILLIAVGGVALFGVSGDSFPEALWRAWTYIADAGNHADSYGLGPRLVAVFISFGGMLIFALMLGLVSDAISEKVDSLRKGKSEVIERNHILILGWSDKLGSLLKQLSIAHHSVGGGVVVVLAERDKEQMELDIAKLEFDFMGTSVICRSGSPLILADLKKVSVSKARSIIVLAEVENADQSDARALRVVLSLTGVKEGLDGHVVVEISDLDNEPLVKLVGGDLVETVVAHDVIGRLMIQCARQPGLAQIWEDILGFENAEFYLKRWPQLDGKKFAEVLISFPDAIPCGVKVANGGMLLNPKDDYVLQEGDEVLVVAEEEDSYSPYSPAEVRIATLPATPAIPKTPEKILFCGWRRDIDDMIMVLDAFLAPGSELWMFCEVPEIVREKKLREGDLADHELKNIVLIHREGNANIRRHLESLPLESFSSILILADESLEDSVVKADSRSLATLLLIRDIQSRRMPNRDLSNRAQPRRSDSIQSPWIQGMQHASDRSIIISEILDSRTKHLVSVSEISDYVLSNELVSMALAMVAEDKQINRVLVELFAEEGNEMYIRLGEIYLEDQEELSFYEIMVRARQRREIVIGYRSEDMERALINPRNKHTRRPWSKKDVFIVLAEEE